MASYGFGSESIERMKMDFGVWALAFVVEVNQRRQVV